MKRASIAGVLLIGFFSVGFIAGAGQNDGYYFKVNKSLEVFGSVFRQISQNYVDEIDPEQFIKAGINGMLETLDPYTVYMDQDESEDIDILTNSSYTGLGISIGVRDSMLTITGLYDGYAAQKAGVRIGDRLYSIDSAVVLKMTTKDLRKYTRGESGTIAHLRVLRDGLKDTLDFEVRRDDIQVKNVSYSGMLDNGVGYIKLERFSRRSAEEVRRSLATLRDQGNLRGLVLDLRDNPGGLLDAAVSICEIFVPQGSTIVTTKGRNTDETRVYSSRVAPIEPTLPLAVLINGRSASASEIVAGAIQDLDRGVVVGERSFGKGLVQNVVALPYNSNLKLTTAKYYTPSGRCIQQIDYTKKRSLGGDGIRSDSGAVFYTLNHREVRESHGISPDSTASVTGEKYPEYIKKLISTHQIFSFANQYSSSMSRLPENFKVTTATLKEFESFLDKRKFSYTTSAVQKTQELRDAAGSEEYSQATLKKIEQLEKAIRQEEKDLVQQYANILMPLIENELYRRFSTQKEMNARQLSRDNQIRTASSLIASSRYEAMLALPVAGN